MDLNLGKALADSKFIPYELIVITSTKAVFYIARTNFYIQNAYITRDVLELSNFITFIQLVYQQEKWLDIRNASFNITGKAIESYDPVNIYFDSLYIATYTLRTFMYMITSWNYPEASLSGLVYANNVTVDTTNQQLNDDALIIFWYKGPANMTALNFDLSKYYTNIKFSAAGVWSLSTTKCQPNDGRIQIFDYENISLSIPSDSNEKLGNYIPLFFDLNIYRKVNATLSNLSYNEFKYSYYGAIFVVGNFNSDFYLSNLMMTNSSWTTSFMTVNAFAKVNLYNLTFSSIETFENILFSYYCQYVNITTVSFINFNFSQSSQKEIMLLENYSTTPTYIKNLYFKNVDVKDHPVLRNTKIFSKISIVNWIFDQVTQLNLNPLFTIGTVGGLTFDNNTFSQISGPILSIK